MQLTVGAVIGYGLEKKQIKTCRALLPNIHGCQRKDYSATDKIIVIIGVFDDKIFTMK